MDAFVIDLLLLCQKVIICNKYRKFKNPKISYISDKTFLYIICDKCGSND